jgi:HAD superfamily hydrolase (TIGR01484 family)
VVLATDYDGTLANNGRVSEPTLHSLEKFRQSGRKLVMVTGRVLSDLKTVFSRFDLFDSIVAENGAVLYNPATRETRALAPPPKQNFIDALRRRGVEPLGIGDAIVATWHPHEREVLEVIRKLGLELQVIFNKGAVMVLPSGVNKRSGLDAALAELGISEHNTVGIGDAENDHAFLECCECSVAVANAHPAVKEAADLTTAGGRGAGVSEAIELILTDQLDARIRERHWLALGHDETGDVRIPACGRSILVSGASGSGKSTFVAGFLETVTQRRYQVCVIDPEGDYESFPGAISVGDEKHAPSEEEVLQILKKADSQVIVNLIGIAVAERPAFFDRLLPELAKLRLKTGRPHWIVLDEAHHMLARDSIPSSAELAGQLSNLMLITVHPEQIAPAALAGIDVVAAVGPAPQRVLQAFATAIKIPAPSEVPPSVGEREVLVWLPESRELRSLHISLSQVERKRHKRNYARGELPRDRSFYFRGPQSKLNLRAQNLMMFVQLADGVDDETWLYHLHRGDYSQWIRGCIKDQTLAAEVEAVEQKAWPDERASREAIKSAIERHYTAPA